MSYRAIFANAIEDHIARTHYLSCCHFTAEAGTKGDNWVKENLVQWEGLSPNEATWEDQHSIGELVPLTNLEGKVVLREGGNVIGPKGPEEQKGAETNLNQGREAHWEGNSIEQGGHVGLDPEIKEGGKGKWTKFPDK